jgi:predicted  nucleic acid-binding Zn-ribbon protein
MGYRSFHDRLVELHFSDPTRGLHGATPAEIIHMYHMGLEERAVECCFGLRRIAKRCSEGSSRKREAVEVEDSGDNEASVGEKNSDEDSEGDEDEEDSDQDEKGDEEELEEDVEIVLKPIKGKYLSRLLVFSVETKKRVDNMAKQLHVYLKWQN